MKSHWTTEFTMGKKYSLLERARQRIYNEIIKAGSNPGKKRNIFMKEKEIGKKLYMHWELNLRQVAFCSSRLLHATNWAINASWKQLAITLCCSICRQNKQEIERMRKGFIRKRTGYSPGNEEYTVGFHRIQDSYGFNGIHDCTQIQYKVGFLFRCENTSILPKCGIPEICSEQL